MNSIHYVYVSHTMYVRRMHAYAYLRVFVYGMYRYGYCISCECETPSKSERQYNIVT